MRIAPILARRLLPALLALLLAWAPAWAPAAGEEAIAIIVGPIPPALSFDQQTLKDIFLKRIAVDNAGASLAPLNLPPADPLRVALSLALWGERPAAMQRYWNERYFHGVSPPYVVRSQEGMLRFVAETPGAVGYVAACKADGRVKIVARLPAPTELAAQVREGCRE